MEQLNHQHMIGTAFISNPPTTTEQVISWLSILVEKIGMKILMGPFAIECTTENNEGITGIVVLSTSHASVHCWTNVERPFLKFDVYSCQSFAAQDVIDHLGEFGVVKINYTMIDRNDVS